MISQQATDLVLFRTSNNFAYIEVDDLSELDALRMNPPAMAFVRSIGDFYFLHTPEFWFGEVGTQEKAWVDREDNRWVRAPYSGQRALQVVTRFAHIANEARIALGGIINDGPKNYDGTKYAQFGSNYWGAIWNIYRRIVNAPFVELNEKTCETEGTKLYDVEDGDITLDVTGEGARFIQEQTKKLDDEPLKRFGYDVTLFGSRPLSIIDYCGHPRISFMETHPTRCGYVVTARNHVKGESVLTLSVYPPALPTPTYGQNPKRWVEQTDQQRRVQKYDYCRNVTDEWNYHTFSRSISDGDWSINNFCFLNYPVAWAPIRVTGASFNYPGADYPSGTEMTISLEQGCPIPITGNILFTTIDPQPYWWAVAPVREEFTLMPTGVIGGGLGETSLRGYILPRSEKGRCGEACGIVSAGTALDLYDTAEENWGGMKGHSPLRGLSPGDYVHSKTCDTMYRVTKVQKNILENPSSMTLDKTTHHLLPPRPNAYGIMIGEYFEYYPQLCRREPVYMIPSIGWAEPGLPLLIKGLASNRVELMAPIPFDIPANTRMNIQMAADTDFALYQYYDMWEYYYKLTRYNAAKFYITYERINAEMNKLRGLLPKVYAFQDHAIVRAEWAWMLPPYYKLVPLKDMAWDPEFDEYGETYDEVIANIYARLYALESLKVEAPNIEQTEYMSLLDYGKY
jgi:hypothetical protein